MYKYFRKQLISNKSASENQVAKKESDHRKYEPTPIIKQEE